MKIPRNIMLSEIDASNNTGETFKIGFFTVKCEYREETFQKGGAKPKIQHRQGNKQFERIHQNIKDNRLLHLVKAGTDEVRDIKLDLVVFYNGQRVIH